MNLHQRLIEVRKSVEYLKKDASGHQFKYVSSSQTLGTLRKSMDEQGVLLVPSVLSKEISMKPTKNGTERFFTELSMRFTWVNAEKPEEAISCDWYGQGLDDGEKGVGKALTYAEKYFLLKFFNIATDADDPDSFQDRVERTAGSTARQEEQDRKDLERAMSLVNSCKSADELTALWKKHAKEWAEFVFYENIKSAVASRGSDLKGAANG